MSFIVATNVVASRPPERRPTGTPTAHDNSLNLIPLSYVYSLLLGAFTTQLLSQFYNSNVKLIATVVQGRAVPMILNNCQVILIFFSSSSFLNSSSFFMSFSFQTLSSFLRLSSYLMSSSFLRSSLFLRLSTFFCSSSFLRLSLFFRLTSFLRSSLYLMSSSYWRSS